MEALYIIYHREKYFRDREHELYSVLSCHENSAAPTLPNIIQAICLSIESLQWLGLVFGPRYAWTRYSQLPYILASSVGLYVAFDWGFYVYLILASTYLVFLVLLLHIHNFFISDFGRVACTLIVLYEKVICGPLFLPCLISFFSQFSCFYLSKSEGYLMSFCDASIQCWTAEQEVKSAISSVIVLVFLPSVLILGQCWQSVEYDNDMKVDPSWIFFNNVLRIFLAFCLVFLSYKPLAYSILMFVIITVWLYFLIYLKPLHTTPLNHVVASLVFMSWISLILFIFLEVLEISSSTVVLAFILPCYLLCFCAVLWKVRESFSGKVQNSEKQAIVTNKAKALMKAVARPSAIKRLQDMHSLSLYLNEEGEETSWRIISEEVAHICSINAEYLMMEIEKEEKLVFAVDSREPILFDIWQKLEVSSEERKRVLFKAAILLLVFNPSTMHDFEPGRSHSSVHPHHMEGLLIAIIPSSICTSIAKLIGNVPAEHSNVDNNLEKLLLQIRW